MRLVEWLKNILCKDYMMENETSKNTIKTLEEKVIEMENKIPKPNPKEEYWNNKYPQKIIYYRGRWIKAHGTYETDVRTFLINPLSQELKKVLISGKTDDEIALDCQKWVVKNITYTPDKTQFGIDEYWAYPQETLFLKKGDCDDGAILMANLMEAKGIPYWKIRLAAGNVYDRNGNSKGGHAYVTYYREDKDDWVALDWCFYSDYNIPINNKPSYKDSVIYGKGSVWFSWNRKYAFSESTSIKNMGVKIAKTD